MRRLSPLTALLLLCCGNVFAAMYGDFAVPEGLDPEVRAESAHGGRIAVELSPPDGAPFIVYFPDDAEDGRPYSGLQSIALHLPAAGEVAVFNLGGRAWVGTRRPLPGGGSFFDGYVHRNGLVYNLAFSMDGLAAPDAAIKRALSRIRLLPGLNGSPGMDNAVRAADLLETEQPDGIPELLGTTEAADPGNWVAAYLRGCIAEIRGDPEQAREQYRLASTRKADDIETAAKAAAMTAMSGDAEEGVAELLRLGEMDPDEAAVWEELGKIYLAGGDDTGALAYFTQAACVNPASEIALYNLSFLYAQKGDYENALRRTREFMHYFPWMPNGVVPDVGGAPGMTEERIRGILAEPLPLGCVVSYGGSIAAVPVREEDIRVYGSLLSVECPEPLQEVVEVYAPVVGYDWDWYPRRHRPHRPKPGFTKPNPPWEKPGSPGVRPPKPPFGHPGIPGQSPAVKPSKAPALPPSRPPRPVKPHASGVGVIAPWQQTDGSATPIKMAAGATVSAPTVVMPQSDPAAPMWPGNPSPRQARKTDHNNAPRPTVVPPDSNSWSPPVQTQRIEIPRYEQPKQVQVYTKPQPSHSGSSKSRRGSTSSSSGGGWSPPPSADVYTPSKSGDWNAGYTPPRIEIPSPPPAPAPSFSLPATSAFGPSAASGAFPVKRK